MDKTFLEKRIEEEAKEEFVKEWNDFVNVMRNHPIFGKIRIKIEDKSFPLATFGVNFAIFNQNQEENERNEFLNFEEVKEQIIQQKIKNKTDELLKKLSSIGYLFEGDRY